MEFSRTKLYRDGKIDRDERNTGNHVFDLTVNQICKPCNEGWLEKQIEAPASIILKSLINGLPFNIDRSSAAILSLWASKTAIVRRLVDLPLNVKLFDPYDWVKSTLSPPPNTSIWMARWEMTNSASTNNDYFVLENPSSNEPIEDTHLTTICIGHCVFFVLMSSNLRFDVQEGMKIAMGDSNYALPIYPFIETFQAASLPKLSLEFIDHFRIEFSEAVIEMLNDAPFN